MTLPAHTLYTIAFLTALSLIAFESILMDASTDSTIGYIDRNEGGYRDKPFKDVETGDWIIGYGRNLSRKGITQSESMVLLRNDIRDSTRDLLVIFSNFNSFTHNRRKALIDIHYNMGLESFREFVRMIDHIKKDEWVLASDELFYNEDRTGSSKYYIQVGSRACRNSALLRDGLDHAD